MAGKLSCLQLFPPFIYLFFFTVLNITSLSLLLEAKCFQCVGLHFRLFKEPSWRKDFIPQPARPQEGVFWMRRKSVFTSETHLRCCANCIQQQPWHCPCGWVQAIPYRHRPDAALNTTLSRSLALQMFCCRAALPLGSTLAAPGDVLGWPLPWPSWQPTEGLTAFLHPFSLLVGTGRGRDTVLFGQAAMSRTVGTKLCSLEALTNTHCHQAEEQFTEC